MDSNTRGGRALSAGAIGLALCALSGAAAAQCGNMHVHTGLLNLLPDGTADISAVQSGAWSDPATWGGVMPGPGDDVLVPAGVEVVYDIFDDGDGLGADTTRFHFVRVDGTLRWATDRDTAVYLDTLFTAPGSTLMIGSDTDPIPAAYSAEIVIIADETADPLVDPNQLSRGVLPHAANWIVGAEKLAFGALEGDALAGATSLTLAETPVGWGVGDTLVLAGTWYDPDGDDADNSRFHDEVVTVTAISGDTVSFTNTAPGFAGLRWDHVRPDGAHFDPSDLEIHVANMTRNVTFRSELDPSSPDAPQPGDTMDLRRGHFMAMHTPEVVTRNAAFLHFGRLNKDEFIDDPGTNLDGTPGSGTNKRGRYVYHLHRNLPRNDVPVDFDACDPSVVTGCVAWGCPGWGFVHHDSYAVFERNVAFDILGSAFVQEAGNEIGRWEGNLSIKTTGDDGPSMDVEPFGDGYKRVTNFDFGFNGEAYWVQGASQVEFIGNIAASAAGGGIDVFSEVDANTNQDARYVITEHLPADRRHIVTNGTGTITVNRVPMNTFRDFTVYNSDFGLITWGHMRNQGDWIGFTCPCDGNVHREYSHVDGFRFWNIYGQGVHLQYTSQVRFSDGLVASSDLATPGVDDKPGLALGLNGDGRGFGFGMNGPTKRLILDNVAVEGWLFGVRTPLEGQINDLDYGENTGSEGAQGLPLRRTEFRDLKLANNEANFYRRQNGFTETVAFANAMVIEGGDFEMPADNLPPVAAFDYESIGDDGVVRLSGLPSRDWDTPGEFLLPFEPPTVARNDPNFIVSYAWDLDGDGAADAHGETVTLRIRPGTSREITLTVWDHWGATASATRTVTPVTEEYGELIVNGAFDDQSFVIGMYALGSQYAGTGWAQTRAENVGGEIVLSGQYNFAGIGQSVYNDYAHRGLQTLRFTARSVEGQDEPSGSEVNRLTAVVYGINGEHGSFNREARPRPAGAIPVEIVPLYEETFTGGFPRTDVERVIDFGLEGYQYVYVSFAGEGVSNQGPTDALYVDDVSLGHGAPGCSPADIAPPYGTLDLDDINAFVAAFTGQSDGADLSGDGVFDLTDIAAFVEAFSGGCPI